MDDFSRHTWVHLMKNKSETRNLLQHFVIHIKNQFAKSIKTIRTDNGKELCWNDFYDKNGIIHKSSCNETPQQNSIVERKHQHILNVIRCIMFQSNLPNAYWYFAILHSVYLINRFSSPVIQNRSPYELLYKCMPVLADIKVIGCLCFASTLEQNRHKFDPRAHKCIFLGYKQGVKGYIVMDIHSREIYVSRNVVFYETRFCDMKNRNSQPSQPITREEDDFMMYLNDGLEQPEESHFEREEQRQNENNVIHDDLRRSTRIRRPYTYMEDYHHQMMVASCNKNLNSKVHYPFDFVISYNKLSDKQLKYTLSLSSQIEPRNFEEAKGHPEWLKAMESEIKALELNRTW